MSHALESIQQFKQFKNYPQKGKVMRFKQALVSGLLALVCLSSVPISGQEKSATPPADTKPVSLAVFKNGLGFVVRQGKINLVEDGWGTIHTVPNATFGSLWLAPGDPGVVLEEVIASQADVTKPKSVQSLAELLEANAGKIASITVNDKVYSGEILSFQETPEATPLRNTRDSGTAYSYVPPQVPSELFFLKVNDSVMAFRHSQVQFIALGPSPVTKLEVKEKAKLLKFKAKGATSAASITMGYLQKGMGWTPSYLVSLKDDKTAQVTMQAVLINDIEDLLDTDVFFVVGFPNFAVSDIPSPMTLQQTLAEFMASLQSGGSSSSYAYGRLDNLRTNRIMAQQANAYEADDTGLDYSTTVNELEGNSEEDLFLYNRQHVNLKKGERGTYNVFSSEVPYEHVYQWDVSNILQIDDDGNINRSAAPKAEDQVWHSLRLKNVSNVPWTTAPAMTISGNKPIAQDILNYTPKSASTLLKLTVATDVRVERQELETERVQNAKKRYGYDYDAVTVTGTLKVKNFKPTNIKLSIKKTVRGEVITAAELGKPEKLAVAIQAINPTSRITWDIPLKPGEEKTIQYTYKVFVRP